MIYDQIHIHICNPMPMSSPFCALLSGVGADGAIGMHERIGKAKQKRNQIQFASRC